MEIRRISTDSGLPVRLEALKEDLRVDDDDFDATLTRMAQTAAGMIERRSGYVLLGGEFEALFDLCDTIKVQRAPLRELISLEAMTAANEWTAIDLADLRLIQRERDFELSPYPTLTAPSVWTPTACTRLRFTAGFAVDPDDSDAQSSGDEGLELDPTVRGVYIALVAHLYENRELFAADKMSEIQSTAGGLLNAIRTFW